MVRSPRGKPTTTMRSRSSIVRKTQPKRNPVKNKDKLNTSTTMKKPKRSNSKVVLPQRPYVAAAVKELLQNAKKKQGKPELLDEDTVVSMQISIGKIPKWRMQTVRFPLAHSVIPASADILLITPDLEGKKNVDYATTIAHYKDLLKKHNIKCVKEIRPYQQIQKQFQEYEVQGKLLSLYDMIITDKKIASKVNQTLGPMITKRHKLLNFVKLQASNLAGAFENALKTGQLLIHGRGDHFAMQVGRTGMKESELVDNILSAAEGLDAKLPGGFSNVRALYLGIPKGKTIPFYISELNFSPVDVPTNVASAKSPVKGELSTEMDAKVTVTAGGDVFLGKKKGTKKETKVKRLQRESEPLQKKKKEKKNKEMKKKEKKIKVEQ